MDSATSEGATDDASPDSEQQLRAVDDDQLRNIFVERLRRTDGEKDGNCFIRPAANSDATFREGDDVDPIQMDAGFGDARDEDIDVKADAVTEFDHLLHGNVPRRRLELEGLMREMATSHDTLISPKSQKALLRQQSPKSADAAAGTAAADKSPRFCSDSTSPLDATCAATDQDGGEAHSMARAAVATSPEAAVSTACGSPGMSRGRVNVLSPSDLDADEAESLQYEWQFEILNSMPREKAIALVERLKQAETDRAQATAATAQLQRDVKELEQQLQEMGMQKNVQFAGVRNHGLSRPGRQCRCLCALLMFLFRLLAVVLIATAAGAVALQSAGVAPGSHLMDHIRHSGLLSIDRPELKSLTANAAAAADGMLASLLPRGNVNNNLNCKADTATKEVQLLRAQLEKWRQKSEICEAKLQVDKVAIANRKMANALGSHGEEGVVRQTDDREMQVPRNITEEYDPKTFEQLAEEHKAMKAQLAMLQNDIDDAMHHGRTTVCWPIH